MTTAQSAITAIAASKGVSRRSAQFGAFYKAIDVIQPNAGLAHSLPGYPTAMVAIGYPNDIATSDDNSSGAVSQSHKLTE